MEKEVKDRLEDPQPEGILYMFRLPPEVAEWVDRKARGEMVPPAVILREIVNEEYEHMAGMDRP
jgi:predicted DNA-binding protein